MTACALAVSPGWTARWQPVTLGTLREGLPGRAWFLLGSAPIGQGDARDRVARVAMEPGPDLDAEAELCARAQAGDRAALGELLRRHGPRLYRSVLLPRLGSRSLAEEALGATYVKVVERFDRFTWQKVGVYPWLRVVALRVAVDLMRSRRRERIFNPADLERELDAAERDDRTADVLERHDLEIARRRVEEALGRIHERYAQVIRLRVLEERSREEAARELGVTVSTLDVVLHRAMAALKKALATEGGSAS
ncbi:MAG TPA: RNA polymerase sigma factor [Polyangiaceae bacterium]|nr:RNA polymerase sigma factor [Polyangiaceae bacterium]